MVVFLVVVLTRKSFMVGKNKLTSSPFDHGTHQICLICCFNYTPPPSDLHPPFLFYFFALFFIISLVFIYFIVIFFF